MFAAWPRSAQLAVAFLLGLVVALLFEQVASYSRWGTRPTELEPGADFRHQVDLNRAQRPELLLLPGVGNSLAERIEEYRSQHGAFHDIRDLTQVKGIGLVSLERLRPWVRIEADPSWAQPEGTKNSPGSSARTTPRKPARSNKVLPSQPIQINQATEAQLRSLPGIGPKLAQRIVEERARSMFKSVEDLRRVKGIGPTLLERLRPHILVDGETFRVATAGHESLDGERGASAP